MFIQNIWQAIVDCHPPCGGCGLKYDYVIIKCTNYISHPPCGGCGLKSMEIAILGGEKKVTLRVEGVD